MHRAQEAGVGRLIVTGSSDTSNWRAWDLSREYAGVLYATAGVHPHHANDYSEQSDTSIRELVAHDSVVAVGECGLDYCRNFSAREAQIGAFRAQLKIAADTGKPVFLHQRDAHDDFVEVLAPVLPGLSRAVAHCFTGGYESLQEYLDMGLYIGITGWICDERRGRPLYRIAAAIPDERLMIETDAPYLMPRTLKPKPPTRRNEPVWLTEVLRVVAAARQQSVEHVAAITTANAVRFFGLPA